MLVHNIISYRPLPIFHLKVSSNPATYCQLFISSPTGHVLPDADFPFHQRISRAFPCIRQGLAFASSFVMPFSISSARVHFIMLDERRVMPMIFLAGAFQGFAFAYFNMPAWICNSATVVYYQYSSLLLYFKFAAYC